MFALVRKGDLYLKFVLFWALFNLVLVIFVLVKPKNSHTAEGLQGADCRKDSTVSLHTFLVVLLIIANSQSIFTSSCNHCGFHMWFQVQGASRSLLCLLDLSLVLLPLHHDENGDKIEHYLFTVSVAWNRTMESVMGLRKKCHTREINNRTCINDENQQN